MLFRSIEIKVPDIGDFKNIPIIEILVKPGDTVSAEDPLLSLESDKATMEVPAPVAGTVKELKVKVGDKVSKGSLILVLDADAATAAPTAGTATPAATPAKTAAAPAATPATTVAHAAAPVSSAPYGGPKGDIHAEVVVLGAGPGGYTAAFRAADLGLKTVLIERHATLGGVCLNVGCIPSKALLHVAKVITEAGEMSAHGVTFGAPRVDLDKLLGWKDSVIGKLTKGLSGLARQRKVTVVEGRGEFSSPHMIRIETKDGVKTVSFDHCIIAAGSSEIGRAHV